MTLPSPIVANALREWKLVCPKSEKSLVFPTGAGEIEYHSNIVTRGLQPIQVAAGVADTAGKAKYPGLHSLRHFYASGLINRRADGGLELPPKMVQEHLVHSSIVMTMDVYGSGGTRPARLGLRLNYADVICCRSGTCGRNERHAFG